MGKSKGGGAKGGGKPRGAKGGGSAGSGAAAAGSAPLVVAVAAVAAAAAAAVAFFGMARGGGGANGPIVTVRAIHNGAASGAGDHGEVPEAFDYNLTASDFAGQDEPFVVYSVDGGRKLECDLPTPLDTTRSTRPPPFPPRSLYSRSLTTQAPRPDAACTLGCTGTPL